MNAFMYSEGTEPMMLLLGLVVLVSMVYWSYVQYVYCGTRIQSAIFLSLSTTLAERQMTHIAHYHLNEAAVLLLMLARRSRVKHYKGPCKLILLLATVSHHIHYYYCSSLQSTAQQQQKKTKILINADSSFFSWHSILYNEWNSSNTTSKEDASLFICTRQKARNKYVWLWWRQRRCKCSSW